MSRWDIQPAGVQAVLRRTAGVASEFEDQMRTLNAELKGARRECNSVLVASAIAGFVNAQSASIKFVFTRTGACMNAAAQATNAYLEGDLEMAANAQASATAAPNARPRRTNVPQ